MLASWEARMIIFACFYFLTGNVSGSGTAGAGQFLPAFCHNPDSKESFCVVFSWKATHVCNISLIKKKAWDLQ
jgi:hypothetical protein